MARAAQALLLACAVLLGGCGSRTEDREPILVRVVDPDAKPIPSAQVQPRYAPGWRRVGSDGTLRLPMVPLRAGEEPTAESLGHAVDVRAPFYGRRDRPADVTRGAETDHWTLVFTMEKHGVLRVHVPVTRFSNAEAHVFDALGVVEALDGIEVARPGQPAAFRVFPGAKGVTVDLQGDAGMAWKRRVVEAPSPGFLREISIVPEAAKPIAGRVVAPDPAPPTLAGKVLVTELHEDGSRVAREAVVVADDGGFTVPYVAPGRFELRPQVGVVRAAPVVVSAGEFAEIRANAVGPWFEAELVGVEEERRAEASVRLLPDGESERTIVRSWHVWKGRHLIEAGSGTLEVSVRGTDRLPPRRGKIAVAAHEKGGVRVVVATEEVAHGTIVIRGAGIASGTTFTVGGRTKTYLAGLGDLSFPNVEAGATKVGSRRPDARAPSDASLSEVTVRPGETTVLEIPAR